MRADFTKIAEWRRLVLRPRAAKQREARRAQAEAEIRRILAKQQPVSKGAVRWREVLINFLSRGITNDAF